MKNHFKYGIRTVQFDFVLNKNKPAIQVNCFTKGTKMNFFSDLWGFLRERKKYWLLPIILTLLLFGALIVLTSGTAVAPFIYTLF